MENVLLGRTVKAMCKLSGKTISQISEDTDISIDTINNLFYARIQKPGFDGVCKLVNDTGFTVNNLIDFLEYAKDMPSSADILDEFTKFIFSVDETTETVEDTKNIVKSTEKNIINDKIYLQIKKINDEYDKKLEKYKEAQLNYVVQIQERYKDQIKKMDEAEEKLLKRYEESLNDVKKSSAKEIENQEKMLKHLRISNIILAFVSLILVILNFVTVLTIK